MLKINEAISNLTVNSRISKLEFVRYGRDCFVFVYRMSMFNLRVVYYDADGIGTYEILPAMNLSGKYATVKIEICPQRFFIKEIQNVEYLEFLDIIETSINESSYEENGKTTTFVFRDHVMTATVSDEYIQYKSENSDIIVEFSKYCPPNTCDVRVNDKTGEVKYYTCQLNVKDSSSIRIAMPEDMNALV